MYAMAVPDFGSEDLENLIGLFNAGWDSLRLAGHFELPEATVVRLLDSNARTRFRRERAAAAPAAEPVPPQRTRGSRRAFQRLAGLRDYERPAGGTGEGLPAFAHHDEHVAAVMAEGGFASLTERWTGKRWALGLPLVWPAPMAEAAP